MDQLFLLTYYLIFPHLGVKLPYSELHLLVNGVPDVDYGSTVRGLISETNKSVQNSLTKNALMVGEESAGTKIVDQSTISRWCLD